MVPTDNERERKPMIEAKDTVPGRTYRPTKVTYLTHNTYYTRPKQSAAEYIRRIEKRINRANGREASQVLEFRRNPDMILLVRRSRGTDPMSGRYETTAKLLVKPDYRLREVKSKPGYGRPSTASINKYHMERDSEPIKVPSVSPKPQGVIKSNPLAALKSSKVDSDDAMGSTLAKAIDEKAKS